MASSLTYTVSVLANRWQIVRGAWTAHTDGVVTGVPVSVDRGRGIRQVLCIPGTGDDLPDDNWDVTIKDADGMDLIKVNGGTLGTDIDQTVGAVYTFNPPVLVLSNYLLPAVSGAGSGNKGQIVIVLE